MATLRLRWQSFWARRARGRLVAAFTCLIFAALAAAYLALPIDLQQHIAGVALAVRAVVATNVALVAIPGVFIMASMLLIFAPGYRRANYFATSRSHIPPVTVYLDAENQISEKELPAFSDYLIGLIDGRRADRLYFLDASITATGNHYKELYRHGFRPVDVPHNPTGKGSVNQAVDKELAMHAYERALLGPPNQEFILVAGDKDYVHLVYRLVALGHTVKILAKPIHASYITLASYVTIELIDLAEVLPPTSTKDENATQLANQSHQFNIAEERLFTTLEKMMKRIADYRAEKIENKKKFSYFRSYLGDSIRAIGYNVGNKYDYWLEHLRALGVIANIEYPLPKPGSADIRGAAQQLLAMAQASAFAATRLAQSRESEYLAIFQIADELIAHHMDYLPDLHNPLFHLLTHSQARRGAHVRYFIRCAKALGLIAFESADDSYDKIKVTISSGK